MTVTMMRMVASPLPYLLLIFSILSRSPSSSTAFSPTTFYFLTCGSSRPISLLFDNPSRLFLSDTPYLTSSSSSVSVSNPNSSATTSPLYSSARLFTSPASYQFNTTSQGTFILRLHFFPFTTPSHNLSAANFSVSAPGRFALLTHFSAATSGAAAIKEYYISVDTEQFTLTFTPTANSATAAFVNAIELFTAPPNLIDGSSPTYITSPASSGKSVPQVPSQGMETLYRVNVGGPLVTPANDTLWRTWVTDDPFVFQSQAVSVENSTSTTAIKYKTNDPRRTPEIAPVSVYDTARTMNVFPMLSFSNPDFNFNVTWSFAVPPLKTYFIRMHFCNFMFDPVNFYFDVYIGQFSAVTDLNPGSKTDQIPAAVFYMDFAADSDASGLINVSIGRSNRSTPTTANAFLNGLEIMKLGLDSEDASDHKNGVSMKILIPSIMGGLALLLISVLAGVFVCRRRWPKPPKASPAASLSPFRTSAPNTVQSSNSNSNATTASPRVNFDLQIPFEEVLFATDGFNDKLVIGSGGFGKVYKGVLRDGTKVAVKRGVAGSKQGYPEFQTEIQVLSKIRHRHLVLLIGYCDDQSEMILVYEYMEKGPLKNYLYGSDNLPILTWKQRLEICIGAARGLHYLHTGYSRNIIHRDIKSTNILLGEDYLAKVADFGLSRLGPSLGETHVSTGVKGTFGYLDPEYFKIQKLTDKSDVYSFGVMLFEVLCARPVIDPNQSREQVNLAECAVFWKRRGQLEKIIDPRLVGKINMDSLRMFGETAAKCLARYGVDRPTIGDVLWNLEYALQLQETEVRREPFEDSGAMESQVSINMMRRVPSDAGTDHDYEDRDGGEIMMRMSEGQSQVNASTVFSQLFADDGR